MSQLPAFSFVSGPANFADWKSWAANFQREVAAELSAIKALFAERLTFGDGSANDNISGKWLKDQVTNATPDTDTAFTHNLGVVPIGLFIVKQDKSGVIHAGGAAWTATTITLRCPVASTTFTAFLLAPPTEVS